MKCARRLRKLLGPILPESRRTIRPCYQARPTIDALVVMEASPSADSRTVVRILCMVDPDAKNSNRGRRGSGGGALGDGSATALSAGGSGGSPSSRAWVELLCDRQAARGGRQDGGKSDPVAQGNANLTDGPVHFARDGISLSHLLCDTQSTTETRRLARYCEESRGRTGLSPWYRSHREDG